MSKNTQKVLSFLAQATTTEQTALTISKELGISTYSVWKSLNELKEDGVITLVPLSASGKTSSHSFIKLNPEKLKALSKGEKLSNEDTSDDERAICRLVDDWFVATKTGDTKTILGLMTDDVVFSVVGREPFGKEVFEAAARQQQNMSIDGTSEIKEIKVLGDWAYIRTYIQIMMTVDGNEPVERSGYTLSILRKGSNGKWRISRDANLLK